MSPPRFTDQEEPFLVLSPEAVNIEKLQSARELLRSTEPVKATLHRDVKVYRPSNNAAQFPAPTGLL